MMARRLAMGTDILLRLGLALQRMAPRMAGQQRYGQTLQKFRKADFARRPV